MAKFYKVVKEHPLWEVGAILSNEDDHDVYRPISDLWLKDIKGVTERWFEGKELVENQPEWFERVYKVTVLKRAMYLSKEAAREAHAKLYR